MSTTLNSLWWAVASSRFSPDSAAQAARSDSLSNMPEAWIPTNRFSDGLDPSNAVVRSVSEPGPVDRLRSDWKWVTTANGTRASSGGEVTTPPPVAR